MVELNIKKRTPVKFDVNFKNPFLSVHMEVHVLFLVISAILLGILTILVGF